MAKVPVTKQFETRGDNEYVAHLAELREIVVRAMAVSDLNATRLAEMANLHTRTVRKFLAGDTIAPQYPTVFRIFRAVGIALTTDASPLKRRRRKS
jgi:DNA-binding phage protein